MRSNRTPAVFFDDILQAIALLQKYCAGLTLAGFEAEQEKQDSILYRLLVPPRPHIACVRKNWHSARDPTGAEFKTLETSSATLTTRSIARPFGKSFKPIFHR